MRILFLLFLPLSVFAGEVETKIPDKAYALIPEVLKQSRSLMDYHPLPYYFLSLIEHESCISLRHSRCWSPTSQLKTSREQGVGLGQITRTWRTDGSLRFDVLTELRQKHPSLLRDLRWSTIKQRPDLQIRAIILLYKGNYDKVSMFIDDEITKLAFSDLSYNAGYGRVLRDRKLCKLKNGCNPDLWFNETETTCSASKKILYGNRSACDIMRHHVRDTLTIRLFKYARYGLELEGKKGDHLWLF